MLEQVGNALTFWAFYTEDKVGKTGLTVTVDVYRGGTLVVSGGSASELGSGLYTYTLASGSVTAENEYAAVFKTDTTTVDQRWLPALWAVQKAGVEHLDAAVSTRLASAAYSAPPTVGAIAGGVWDEEMANHLTAGSTGEKLNAAGASGDPLTNAVPGSYAAGTAGHQLGRIGTAEVGVTAPVSASGTVTITQGTDYSAADGTALVFSSSSALPLNTGNAAVTLDAAGAQFPAAVSGAAGGWTIAVEMTAAQTAALAVGSHPYELRAVLDSGRIAPPLATGTLRVRRDW